MRQAKRLQTTSVIVLTLLCQILLAGCSYLNKHYGETCNYHAYTHSVLSDHISTRFHSAAPVRMAVIPFTVPANLSAYSNDRPGLGNELAWKIQARLLEKSQIPIIEVLNRQDWPGKREEFFTGNYGALSIAHEAGYDLVLVGLLENIRALDLLETFVKVIEVHSGITLWYGKVGAESWRDDFNTLDRTYFWNDAKPARLHINPLSEQLATCVVEALTKEN